MQDRFEYGIRNLSVPLNPERLWSTLPNRFCNAVIKGANRDSRRSSLMAAVIVPQSFKGCNCDRESEATLPEVVSFVNKLL